MGIFHELLLCFLPTHEAFLFLWILAAMGGLAIFITLERWFEINRRTDYNAPVLFHKIKLLIEDKKQDEAFQICASAGYRALPRVLGSGIRKSQTVLEMVSNAMAEESTHMAAKLEKRLNYLVMLSNASTLMGLLGTVFGLIVSFAAVGRPNVEAAEKSAMLASGISAAMNSTLVGLSISIPSIIAYSFLRSRVDHALSEMDCYAIAILKLLVPANLNMKGHTTLVKRSRDEEEAPDTDVTPMLNLMVMLIPFLLTSSEFVKIGAIELKLPESQAQGGDGGGAAQQQEVKLDLGIVITAKGFTIYDYFRLEQATAETTIAEKVPDVPLLNGEYDYPALNKRLSEIKQKVLVEVLKSYIPDQVASASLYQLSKAFASKDFSGNKFLNDHENVKIVAEEQIKYDVVVKVMDAARGTRTPDGDVTMFPNVSIAGGIVQ
jgi:biopolymer transport protein ExbB/TolQ/biopolymer transport protein ExbD